MWCLLNVFFSFPKTICCCSLEFKGRLRAGCIVERSRLNKADLSVNMKKENMNVIYEQRHGFHSASCDFPFYFADMRKTDP